MPSPADRNDGRSSDRVTAQNSSCEHRRDQEEEEHQTIERHLRSQSKEALPALRLKLPETIPGQKS